MRGSVQTVLEGRMETQISQLERQQRTYCSAKFSQLGDMHVAPQDWLSAQPPNLREHNWLEQEIILNTAICQTISLVAQEPIPYRLLEIGCGTGLLAEAIMENPDLQHVDYWGIEFNPDCLPAARKRAPKFSSQIHWGVASSLTFEATDRIKGEPYANRPFEQRSVNMVLMSRVDFRFLDLFPSVLEEVYKVTASHGCLLIASPLKEDNPKLRDTRNRRYLSMNDYAQELGRVMSVVFRQPVAYCGQRYTIAVWRRKH
jgi:ubiquinone/menaquinone biosynthesis C-methylase UbiE